MTQTMTGQVAIRGAAGADQQRVLTTEALEFVAMLHRQFHATRDTLLRARIARQEILDAGVRPDFLVETRTVREG